MERSTARLTYKGSISEAIIEAQNQKKLFLVFISGEDENSTNLENTTWLDDKVAAAVSMYCIFLHFIEGHVEASQFAAIYPQNSVPSISAVGYNGVMLWQYEGYINGRSFVESIEKAWASMHFQSTAAAVLSTALSSEEPVLSRSNSTAVSHIERAEPSSLHDSSYLADSLALNVGAEPSNDPEALIKQLGEDINLDDNPLQLANVNEAKVDMENNKNKENEATEISHSQTQNLPKFQDMPQEHHSFENPAKSFSEPVGAIHLSSPESSQANSNYLDEGRQPVYNEMNVVNAKKFTTIHLSIRMPSGISLQEKFTVTDILRSVKNFVDDNYDSKLGSYELAIPYPRKVFGEEDMNKALLELAFDSRQALIVIPKSEVPRHQSRLLSASNDIQSSANQTNNGTSYFGYLKRALSYMNPFSYLGGSSSSSSEQEGTPNNDDLWQYRGGDSHPQNSFSNPQSTNGGSMLRSRTATSRPFGSNIHTLRHDQDHFSSSSSDRNTFWNGNSTQFGGNDR